MISKKRLDEAIQDMAMLRYFPTEPGTRAAIMILLVRMVETEDQLAWLVKTMINRVGEWRGPKELRGVFCSRFKPSDGVETDCITTAGFTPEELATPCLEAHEDVKLLEAHPPCAEAQVLVRTAVKRMPR